MGGAALRVGGSTVERDGRGGGALAVSAFATVSRSPPAPFGLGALSAQPSSEAARRTNEIDGMKARERASLVMVGTTRWVMGRARRSGPGDAKWSKCKRQAPAQREPAWSGEPVAAVAVGSLPNSPSMKGLAMHS